jgi:hypothetical protein
MYLGETFSSYVVVQNESPILVADASCKVSDVLEPYYYGVMERGFFATSIFYR